MSTPTSVRNAVVVADAPGADLAPFVSLLRAADLIVAADGGARYLLGLEILPSVAVGDFDSLDSSSLAQLEAAGVEVQRFSPHKNETDLELALLVAIEHGASCVHVLAALGGRPDQHLANLQLLTHPALARADVRLLHASWQAFVIHDEAVIHGTPGDTVSLLPMSEHVAGITTTGLYYPLHDEELRLGPARGVSNVLVETHASVRVRSGMLLCMHERRAAGPAPEPS